MILPTIHPPHHFPAKVATSKSCCSSSMVWLQGASPSHFWISTNPSSKHPGFPFPKKKHLHPKQKLRNAFETWHLCILLSMRGPWLRLPGWIRSSFCPGTKNVRAWIAPLVLILSKNTTCEDLWCFNLFGTHRIHEEDSTIKYIRICDGWRSSCQGLKVSCTVGRKDHNHMFSSNDHHVFEFAWSHHCSKQRNGNNLFCWTPLLT